MYAIRSYYERVNLDIHLNENILIIADIGRWNGRFSGYKEISSGNIKDCLYTRNNFVQHTLYEVIRKTTLYKNKQNN